jgi:hypothetical protein
MSSGIVTPEPEVTSARNKKQKPHHTEDKYLVSMACFNISIPLSFYSVNLTRQNGVLFIIYVKSPDNAQPFRTPG